MQYLSYANVMEAVFLMVAALMYMLPFRTAFGEHTADWPGTCASADGNNGAFFDAVQLTDLTVYHLLLCSNPKECGFLCGNLVGCDNTIFYEFMACAICFAGRG